MNEKVKDNTCLQPFIIVPSMLSLQAGSVLHHLPSLFRVSE